jgi:hypothetical protein
LKFRIESLFGAVLIAALAIGAACAVTYCLTSGGGDIPAPAPAPDAEFDVLEPIPEPGPLPVSRYRDAYYRTLQGTQVLLLTADWCGGPCRVAKRQVVPWLEDAGWKVAEVDFDHLLPCGGDQTQPASSLLDVSEVPTWIVVRDCEERGRYTGTDREELGALLRTIKGDGLDAIALALAAHVGDREAGARSPGPAYEFRRPAVRILDLLQPLAGQSIALGDVATLSVPATLAWKVEREPEAIRLAFEKPPALTFRRWVRWEVTLTALVVRLETVTVELSRFPDFTVQLQW